MLLETAPGPFSHSEYIFEPKVDGHRLIYSQQSGNVRLYTRHNNDCTRQYPELQLPFDGDIILDGQVTCTDPATGLNDFEAVMSRFSTRQHSKVQQLIKTLPATFIWNHVYKAGSKCGAGPNRAYCVYPCLINLLSEIMQKKAPQLNAEPFVLTA
ncbi:hypothetical protein [Paenibacillus sp. BIC5C1]|uniref:ATP-dependent DNA ligase n=1 Tax=Paenibacillus sp. BIC5C1 TaxID=3078263 RepID=UPI0028ED6B12|nr:hypothetical protein [Paenibacillus sp. BIC5C1]